MWLLVPIFFLGFLTPIQTAANSRLRQAVISPMVASLVSFTVGTLFLAIIVLCEKGSLLIESELISRLPWWAWFGGLCGLWGLTVNIIIFPKLGAVQTALMPMLGQIGMGIIIDSFGMLQSPVFPFTLKRAAALVILLTGIVMIVKRKENAEKKSNLLVWQLIGISGGAIFAMQPSMNSLLSIGLYSSVHAAFVSFVTATIMLFLLVVLIPRDRINIPKIFSFDRPWWSWLGGIIGGTFVTGFAFFASKTGIGLLLVTSICGMLTNSLIIDKYGLLGAIKKRIGLLQYLGLVLVVIGIIILRMN
ncbi:MAG: DMT family transporter [Muribaculaceae bacterium]|nr:DMT family transporter [Muribaculaceae bacterium]